MKLTAGLVFDRLSEYFEIRYIRTSDKSTLVGRPVFYADGTDISGHLCILHSQEQPPVPVENGVFITVGTPDSGALATRFAAQNIELMTLPAAVPIGVLFNRLQKIFDAYDSWENELTEIIESEKGYADLIECGTRFLECPISLVDDEFTIIAFADNLGGYFRDDVNRDKVSMAIMNELLSDPLSAKGLNFNDVFEHSIGGELFLSYNYKRDGKYLGRMTLYYKSKLSKDACRYLTRFLALKIETMLKKFGSFLLHKESFSSLRDIVNEYLRNTPVNRHNVEYRLGEIGWSYADEYLLIRLQPEFRHEWQMHASYLIPMMEREWPGVCAIEKDNFVVILLNLTVYASKSDKEFMQELAYFLREGLMLAGISRRFRGFDHMAAYYKQTELAVSLGRERDPMCWYFCFDDYALDCWLSNGVMNFTPEQICSPVLLYLLEYDHENNTEYCKTLQTFFNRKFSFTHAAEDLYIHRTTLIKRIERIAELTKIDLNDQDELLYLELSFRYLDKIKTA